jgi:16S rRNA (guanine527-N7)-methyltransferase
MSFDIIIKIILYKKVNMDFKKILKTKLNNYNLPNSNEICDNLITFNNLMLDYNKSHNLTSITEENDVIIKHFIDSTLPIDLFPNNSTIIDLGCGGGFPSIPLKIMNKTLNITAVDSVQKKTNFVQLASEALSFDNFNVVHSRIEDLAFKKEYREQYDIVISRALAQLSTVIEYSAPFLKNNGVIISYKGTNYKEELEKSKNALKLLNCKVESIKEYYVSELETTRYIIIIKKLGCTPNKYPRPQNKPRLKPL